MYRMLLIVAFVLGAGPVNPTAQATPNTGAAKALTGAAMQQALVSNVVHRKVCVGKRFIRERKAWVWKCYYPFHH